MRINNLPKPETIWFEDKDGNKLDWSLSSSPDMPEGWEYQISYNTVVTESICGHSQDPKWPVKFLMWLIKVMPKKWQKITSQRMQFSSTINCVYPIVKYLVEKKKWSFNDACIASANLCERCLNICLWEIEGQDLRFHKFYLDKTHTTCKSCCYIDPDYLEQRKVKACYRALKYNKDIKQAWEEGFCSHPSCGVTSLKKDTLWTRIKNWYIRREKHAA